MSELVSDGASFSCNFCTGKLKLMVANSSTDGESKPLATQMNCFLPPPGGNCSLIPGIPPPPCVGAPIGFVVKPGQSSVQIDGQKALGDGAAFLCPLGQNVALSDPGQKVGTHNEAKGEGTQLSLLQRIAKVVSDTMKAVVDYVKEHPEEVAAAAVAVLQAAAAAKGGGMRGGAKAPKGPSKGPAPKPQKAPVDNSHENKGFYNSQKMRSSLEKQHPNDTVTSTTVPNSNQKNVKLAGKRNPKTGVVHDSKGFPIFDDVAKFDTKIPKEIAYSPDRIAHQSAATKSLREHLTKYPESQSAFTKQQVNDIMKGKPKIEGYTWHHHQDVGRMQLVPEKIHATSGHVGGANMWKGN